MIGLLKNFIQQTMDEEIKHVNMHINVPYISRTDDSTYFKIIPCAVITYEENIPIENTYYCKKPKCQRIKRINDRSVSIRFTF